MESVKILTETAFFMEANSSPSRGEGSAPSVGPTDDVPPPDDHVSDWNSVSSGDIAPEDPEGSEGGFEDAMSSVTPDYSLPPPSG